MHKKSFLRSDYVRVQGGANSKLTYDDFADITMDIDGLYTNVSRRLADGSFTAHSQKQTVEMRHAGWGSSSSIFEALILPPPQPTERLLSVFTRQVHPTSIRIHPIMPPQPSTILLSRSTFLRQSNR